MEVDSDDLDWAAIEQEVANIEARRSASAVSLPSQASTQASLDVSSTRDTDILTKGTLEVSEELFSQDDEYDFDGIFLEDAPMKAVEAAGVVSSASGSSFVVISESATGALSSSDTKTAMTPEQLKADMSRIDFGDKAGTEFADKTKVNQVIYEMSKNSEFYRNEQRKGQKTQERIEELLKAKATLKPPGKKLMEWVESYIVALESSRDVTQTWVHCDMDAFYAAVEIRDNPSLKGKPVAVGGNSMITTSSYEARKFGVRSAMPGFIGKQLCPELIFVKPHFKKYEEASEITRQVYSIYDPNYEPLSLDEAGLNITEYLNANPDKTWEDVVIEIRRFIFERTQLTCSCGISCNRRLAKLAADVNKPNNYFRIDPNREAILKYIRPLPVRKLWGVGKVTEQLLNGIGIKTVDDLYRERYMIAQLFSEISFKWFIASSLGIGGEQHSEEQGRKSIGRQRTFQRESSSAGLLDQLSYICKLVAKDLAEENLKARCITLITKSASFQLKTRAKTIARYICQASDIFNVAKEMLEEAFPLELRLIGVRLTHFENEVEEAAVSEGNKPITKFFQKTSKEEFQKQVEVELTSLKDKTSTEVPTKSILTKSNSGSKSVQEGFKEKLSKPGKNAMEQYFKECPTADNIQIKMEKDFVPSRKRSRDHMFEIPEELREPPSFIDLTQTSPEPPMKKSRSVEAANNGTLLAMLKRPSF